MSEAPLVVLEGVAKIYGEAVQTRALSDVNARIDRGEIVALAGPSGSGKSTLLNLLGLLDRPSAGRIILGGVDTTGKSDRELTELRAKMLGFVFQFHHLLPAFDAVENVMLPAWCHAGRPSEAARRRAEELLRLVGLGHRLDRRPNQLSGGEQQRVAIARALVNEPSLILADEPTGNLDSHTGDEIMRLLCDLREERGATLIIATHDSRVAAAAERVVELVDGIIERQANCSVKPAG
jgi:lipoprotein-releasing system ATP-binding protein